MKQLTPFITERDGIPVTTSRAVAEQFGKHHKNVIRDIEELISQLNFEPAKSNFSQSTHPTFGGSDSLNQSKNGAVNQPNFRPVDDLNERKIASVEGEKDADNIAVLPSPTSDFAAQNFLLVEYTDAQGKPRPEYLLTRDGFTLLAMGFTGAKALTFKVAYINAFNHMEQLLRGGITSSALKNIEERLQALEKTAGEGKPDAMHKVGQIYLSALKKAIESGKYTIEKRFARHDNPKKLLGLEDYDYVAVKTVLSYRIYSAYAKKPLARLALWGVLEGAGAILPKDKRPTRVNISGTKYTVIYIPTSKLFDRAEEAENRTE